MSHWDDVTVISYQSGAFFGPAPMADVTVMFCAGLPAVSDIKMYILFISSGFLNIYMQRSH